MSEEIRIPVEGGSLAAVDHGGVGRPVLLVHGSGHNAAASTMPAWHDVLVATPELAQAVQARFDKAGLGCLATVRADGSPRIAGIKPLFGFGGAPRTRRPGYEASRTAAASCVTACSTAASARLP
jgi:hypothetical protein